MIGKIYNFNGFAGKIITENLEYPFNKNNIFDEIKNGDLVSFVVDYIEFGGEKIEFAKNIRKYDKELDNGIANQKINKNS